MAAITIATQYKRQLVVLPIATPVTQKHILQWVKWDGNHSWGVNTRYRCYDASAIEVYIQVRPRTLEGLAAGGKVDILSLKLREIGYEVSKQLRWNRGSCRVGVLY